MIQKGQKIKIKGNLREEMERLKFNKSSIDSMVKQFEGTEQTAYDVYLDKDNDLLTEEWFVEVELCCVVPIAACELAV